MRIGVRAACVGLMAALIALVATSTSSSAPNLLHGVGADTPPSERGLNVSMKLPRNKPTAMIFDNPVCAARNVRVDSVTLVHAHGFRLRRWGVSNVVVAGRLGDAGTLALLGDYRSHEIAIRCGAQHWATLGLEFERTSTTSATMEGLTLHYRSDGERKTLTLWEGFALCGKDGPAPYNLDPTDTSDHAEVLRDCDGAD